MNKKLPYRYDQLWVIKEKNSSKDSYYVHEKLEYVKRVFYFTMQV